MATKRTRRYLKTSNNEPKMADEKKSNGTDALRREIIRLKSLYGFLEPSQIEGKARKNLGLPQLSYLANEKKAIQVDGGFEANNEELKSSPEYLSPGRDFQKNGKKKRKMKKRSKFPLKFKKSKKRQNESNERDEQW